MNSPPQMAAKASISTPVNTPLNLAVYPADPDGDAMSVTFHSALKGTLAPTSNPKAYTYEPPKDYIGTDTVLVDVTDGKSPAVTQEITISVWDSPAARHAYVPILFPVGTGVGAVVSSPAAPTDPLLSYLASKSIASDKVLAAMKALYG
jgi:hypothetical protein